MAGAGPLIIAALAWGLPVNLRTAQRETPMLRLTHFARGDQGQWRLLSPPPRASALLMVDAQGRVTRVEAEAALEGAEVLAAEALSVRKQADALAEEAEEVSGDAAEVSESAASKMDGAVKFSLSMLTASTSAQHASLNAGALISEAVALTERADQLDIECAVALEDAEALVAQHYDDFPESD